MSLPLSLPLVSDRFLRRVSNRLLFSRQLMDVLQRQSVVQRMLDQRYTGMTVLPTEKGEMRLQIFFVPEDTTVSMLPGGAWAHRIHPEESYPMEAHYYVTKPGVVSAVDRFILPPGKSLTARHELEFKLGEGIDSHVTTLIRGSA